MAYVFYRLVLCCVLAHTAALLQGFHVDDESCSGLVADNVTQQVAKCATFFTLLSNLSKTLRAASDPASGELPPGYPTRSRREPGPSTA